MAHLYLCFVGWAVEISNGKGRSMWVTILDLWTGGHSFEL